MSISAKLFSGTWRPPLMLGLSGGLLVLGLHANRGAVYAIYALAMLGAALLLAATTSPPALTRPAWRAPGWGLGLLGCGLVWGVAVSPAPWHSVLTAVMLGGLPLGYAVGRSVPWCARPAWTAWLLAGALGWALVLAFLQAISGELLGAVPALEGVWRLFYNANGLLTGPFLDRNLFSALCNLGVLGLSGWWLAMAPSPRRTALGLLLLAGAVATVASASRMGVLLLLSGGGALGVLYWRQGWQISRRTGYGALLAAAVVVTVAGGPVLHRFGKLAAGDASASSRWYILQTTLDIGVEQPAGRGLGLWSAAYAERRLPPQREGNVGLVHNDYLQGWVEGGPLLVLGLATPLLTGLALFRWLWRQRRPAEPAQLRAAGYVMGLVSTGVHAGFNFLYYQPGLGLLIGLLLAQALQVVPQVERTSGSRAWQPIAGRVGAIGLLLVAGLGITGQAATNALGSEEHAERRWLQPWLTEGRLRLLAQWSPWDPRPAFALAYWYLRAAEVPGLPVAEQRSLRQAAYREFEEYARRDPLASTSYQNRGALLLRFGPQLGIAEPRTEAKRLLTRAVELRPEALEALFPLCRLLAEDGHAVSALVILEHTRRRTDIGPREAWFDQVATLLRNQGNNASVPGRQ